ncbi:Uncharacterised protein [Mycobacteroides abscessus]|nr:Uncharacterised protein [Mycobacteroides abscessus]
MELVEPEQCIGDKEIAYLGASEIENICSPVQLLGPVRIGVFIQRCAVEAGQCPGVLGEVRGHPIDEYPDARAVQGIDQIPEVIGCAEP